MASARIWRSDPISVTLTERSLVGILGFCRYVDFLQHRADIGAPRHGFDKDVRKYSLANRRLLSITSADRYGGRRDNAGGISAARRGD